MYIHITWLHVWQYVTYFHRQSRILCLALLIFARQYHGSHGHFSMIILFWEIGDFWNSYFNYQRIIFLEYSWNFHRISIMSFYDSKHLNTTLPSLDVMKLNMINMKVLNRFSLSLFSWGISGEGHGFKLPFSIASYKAKVFTTFAKW